MSRGANFMVDSDDVETMTQLETESDSEELLVERDEHCFQCNQPRCDMEPTELEKRRNRKTQHILRHCPSCHCSQETVKHSTRRAKTPKHMEAVLNRYENLLITPTSKAYPKSQSSSLCPCKYLSENTYHQPRKRTTSSHRRQYKNEEDRMLSVMKNVLNSGVDYVHDVYCEHPSRSLKSSCRKEGGSWRDEQMVMTGIAGSMEIQGETAGKCALQHKKEPTWSSRQHGEKINEKYELGDREDNDTRCTSGTLRFNLAQYEDPKKIDSKRVEDDRKEQTRKKSSILKACSLQTSSKTKNVKDLSKPKVSLIDDYSKDKDLAIEERSTCKPRKQSAICQDSPCSRQEEESTSNKEDVKEDSYRELTVKDNDPDSPYRKYIFAGGDLDLHTTKSHILGLIDKALSNNFVTASEQQKNAHSSEGLMEEVCIGITRTLQGDCCQPLAEDLFGQCESGEEYIQKLKVLKWEHMKLIQNEFRKLWKLQQFLDNYSPRQSLAADFQPRSSAIEQRAEERQEQQQQQQHEEKQKNLGKIS